MSAEDSAAPMEAGAAAPMPRPGSFETEPDGVMVFRPTLEEMKDFCGYIRAMESVGAHLKGIAKVIPPVEYCPRKEGYDSIQAVIQHPISQVVQGREGLYNMINLVKRKMTAQQFQALAEGSQYARPERAGKTPTEIERYFWRNLSFNPAIYGADVPGSITDESCDIWNVARLPSILDELQANTGKRLLGVNTPYLYFGMWKAAFCWHTEDMDLYSINYIHKGAEKQWYAIPTAARRRMDTVLLSLFPAMSHECRQFQRHKMTLVSPAILRSHNIPVVKTVHHAGEFIVTFPGGYHAGYNLGFNIAESTNFATERWVEIGMEAQPCLCRSDTVRISMAPFVEKYLPDKWPTYEAKLKQQQQSSSDESSESEDDSTSCVSTEASDSSQRRSRVPVKRKKRAPKSAQRPKSKLQSRAQAHRAKLLRLFGAEKEYNQLAATPDRNVCAVCFGQTSQAAQMDNEERADQNPETQASADTGSPMLHCSSCGIAVHKGCFPRRFHADSAPATKLSRPTEEHQENDAQMSEDVPGWICPRCTIEALPVPCMLCRTLGGPLLPTRTGGWAHVICALLVPETSIADDGTVVGVEDVPRARWHLRCAICTKRLQAGSRDSDPPMWPDDLSLTPEVSPKSYLDGVDTDTRPGMLQGRAPAEVRNGAPIQCAHGRCTRPFHASCARARKQPIRLPGRTASISAQLHQIDGSPTTPNEDGWLHHHGLWAAYCHQHDPEQKPRSRPQVSIGQRVLGKWRQNNKFYWGYVTHVRQSQDACLLFADNTVSCYIPADEFEPVGDCVARVRAQSGRFNMNDTVTIRWDDGIDYTAKIVKLKDAKKYTIAFDDGFSSTVERNMVRTEEEPVSDKQLGAVALRTGSDTFVLYETTADDSTAPEVDERTGRPKRRRKVSKRLKGTTGEELAATVHERGGSVTMPSVQSKSDTGNEHTIGPSNAA